MAQDQNMDPNLEKMTFQVVTKEVVYSRGTVTVSSKDELADIDWTDKDLSEFDSVAETLHTAHRLK